MLFAAHHSKGDAVVKEEWQALILTFWVVTGAAVITTVSFSGGRAAEASKGPMPNSLARHFIKRPASYSGLGSH
jgi:hypothetical protein